MDNKQQQSIIELASRCVRCSACVPHCPTYHDARLESESPRGRVALSLAIAKEQVPLSLDARKSLDTCLGCRACETHCPAEVPVLEILDKTKSLLPAKPLPRWLRALMTASSLRRGLTFLLKMSQILHIPKFGKLKLIPPIRFPQRLFGTHKTAGETKGQVQVFMGCVSDVLEQETLQAMIKLINACGYDAVLPKGQVCCGALAKHQGDLDMARHLQQQNRIALKAQDKTVVCATGCSIETRNSLPGATDALLWLKAHIQAISFTPYPHKVLVHTPCSLRYGWRQPKLINSLLRHIPGLEAVEYPNTGCCGAGGANLLTKEGNQTGNAADIVTFAQKNGINTIVTANTGCRCQISRFSSSTPGSPTITDPIRLFAQTASNY